jgi:hypothetical protein
MLDKTLLRNPIISTANALFGLIRSLWKNQLYNFIFTIHALSVIALLALIE